MKISIKLLVAVLLSLCSIPVLGQTRRIEKIQDKEVVDGEIIVRFRPTAAGALSAIRQDADTVSVDTLDRNGDVLIRSRQRTASELLQTYSGRTDVEFAEPNLIWHKTDIPNDPSFPQQWYLQNTGQQIIGSIGVVQADIGAVSAWNTTVGSKNIVVGVIDSGIKYDHADLAANVWSAPVAFDVTIGGQVIHCNAGTHGFNAITRTCDPMDDESHGTAMAGVIGATGMNNLGITGINRISSLIGLKFLDSSGAGSTTDAIAAIEFAIQVQTLLGANIRILNASWGTAGFSQALMDEISSANTHNMLFVTSAGNASADNNSIPTYPANFNLPNIISVAATTNRDNLAPSSNFGSSSVHLGAPGFDIISLHISATVGFFGGTSMSSAMVAGGAALLLAACPQSTSALKSSLLNNVDVIPALSGKTISGGRLNIAKAINSCPGGVSTFSFSGNRTTIVGIRTISVVLTVTGTAGYSGNAKFSALSLPNGVTAVFNPPAVVGSGSTIMTVNIPPGFTANTYPFAVLADDGFISKSINFQFTVPLPIPLNQITNGVLSSSGIRSEFHSGAIANYYQFTQSSSTPITVDMRSTGVNPFLNLLSDTGVILNSDDDSGGGTSARIGPVILSPGSYILEATAIPGQTGSYFVGINIPTLDSISPSSGQAGSSVLLTFKGNGFLSTAKANGFPGGDIPLNVVDSQTLTSNGPIDPSAFAGLYNIRVITSSSQLTATSNTVPFTVTAPPLAITSMSPGAIVPGTTVTFQINGFGFTSGMTVNAGSGITTTVLSVLSANSASVRFVATAGATPGVRNVTVTTAAGTSPAFPLTVTTGAPTLSGISPSTFSAGSTTSATITISNFISGLQLQSDTGIVFSSLAALNDTTALATVTVDSATSFGSHNVVAVTSVGTSNAFAITITPLPPALTLVTPNVGGQGSSTIVALTGNAFRTPLTVNVGTAGDITATNIVIADTNHLTATLNIAGNAALGIRNLSVTTLGGTTAAQPFNVIGAFPDLTITDVTTTTFYQGYPQTYSATVRNLGALPTTGPTTLTHSMTSTFSISAASGSGWSCSISNSIATCVYASVLPPGAASTLTFTTTPAPNITGGVAVLFSIDTSGDLSTTNNSVLVSTTLDPFSPLTISGLSVSTPGTQSEITLTRGPFVFPYDLTGKLTLTFVPNPAVGIDDPFVQFSTGGKVVPFSIAANATQATFPNGAKLFVQSGSLAGTIALGGSIDIPAPGVPKTIVAQSSTIPLAKPSIVSASIDATSGTAFVFNFLSNTRNLSSVTFTFNTSPAVQVSCGNIAGCSGSKNSVTFNTHDLFINWFSANPGYGGAATLRVPFSLDGRVIGDVNVTLTNSAGASTETKITLTGQ